MNLKDKAKAMAKKKGGIWDGRIPSAAVDSCLNGERIPIGGDILGLRVQKVDDDGIELEHRVWRTMLFLIGGVSIIVLGIVIIGLFLYNPKYQVPKNIGAGVATIAVGIGLLFPALREVSLSIDWKNNICTRVFLLGLKKQTTSLQEVQSVNVHFGKQIKLDFSSKSGIVLPLLAYHSSADDEAALFIRFGLHCAKHLNARVNFHGKLEYDQDQIISPVVLHEMSRIKKGKQDYVKERQAQKDDKTVGVQNAMG